MDTATARKRLGDMLSNLDRSIAILRGEHPAGEGELSGYDNHPADAASNLSDADRVEAMLQVAQLQRLEVLAALKRVDEGDFGRCVDCGKPVPEGRLEARPEAARCVSCQAKQERRLR